MTVTNVFIDDNALTAAQLNTDFDDVTVHRKKFFDATERTTNSGSWVDSGTTFTLSAPVGSLIIGLYLSAEVRSSTEDSKAALINLQFSGSNLGTVYLIGQKMSQKNYQVQSQWSTSEDTLVYCVHASYIPWGCVGTDLKLLDASTTIKVRLQQQGGGDAYVQNVTLDILYVKQFVED